MPFIRITIEGLDQVVNGINSAIQGMQTAKQEVLNETADFFTNELRRNAHVISGNMRDSIRSQEVDQNSMLVEVGATYAIYENRRAGSKAGYGPHNFADRAEIATRQRFPNIVASIYGNFFSSL